jgi:hypothetical protein
MKAVHFSYVAAACVFFPLAACQAPSGGPDPLAN